MSIFEFKLYNLVEFLNIFFSFTLVILTKMKIPDNGLSNTVKISSPLITTTAYWPHPLTMEKFGFGL